MTTKTLGRAIAENIRTAASPGGQHMAAYALESLQITIVWDVPRQVGVRCSVVRRSLFPVPLHALTAQITRQAECRQHDKCFTKPG
ncbi:hypothetical protein VTO73DRAFT_12612 [Trametes versicolor]